MASLGHNELIRKHRNFLLWRLKSFLTEDRDPFVLHYMDGDVDDLAMQGARASAATVLSTEFEIPVFTPGGLKESWENVLLMIV